ncbi:MAG: lysylphosphatidylglycerol synthase transmembrane domain-containing protein [Bacteroidales bacterium]|nr:lysylphosphatidylglycerol synthase transmembrane domain-containing protein [Bacteroidales bacterium]
MNPKLKNIIRFSVFLGIGIFFIWIFLRNLTAEQKQEIIHSMSNANYWWIAMAIPLGILSHYLRALRWKMLIESMGYKPGNRNMFFAVMIGYFANLALPRLGEVSRCTILTKYENVPFQKSFGTVITERVLDMLVFILLFFLNLALQAERLSGYINESVYKPLQSKLHLNYNLSGAFTILMISFIVVFGILFLVFRKQITANKFFIKIKNTALGFVEGMKSLVNVRNKWLFFFYTFAIWTLYLLMAFVVFFSIPDSSGLGLDAGLAILVFGTIGIMVVQGGIGIYPAIVAETLVLYGVASIQGYALGWLIWTSQNVTIVLVGIISLILLPILNNRKNEKA